MSSNSSMYVQFDTVISDTSMYTATYSSDAYNVSESGNVTFYDYEPDLGAPLEELLPVSLAYGATLLLGVIGNSLVIFSVCRYEQMMTITNMFLLSLASADLLLVVVCVPVKFVAFFSYIWRLGEFTCKAIHYVQNVSAICSVATLTFMSLERYYAIVHPMKAKSLCTKGRARRVIVTLWLASVILAIPIIIGRIHLVVEGRFRTATWCVKYFYDPVVRKLYDLYMFAVILMIPVIIMTFAYFRICQELWFMAKHRKAMRTASDIQRSTHYYSGYTNSCNSTPVRGHTEKSPVLRVKFKDDDSTKKQVIKMLVAVIVVFILCWAPILINNILVAFGVVPELAIPPHKYIREAFHLMSYANSCVNPIVYGFMSRNFRKTFKRALCGCLKGRQYLRTINFRNQSRTVQEKWNGRTGSRHSELLSTGIDSATDTSIYEMQAMQDKSSSDDAAEV